MCTLHAKSWYVEKCLRKVLDSDSTSKNSFILIVTWRAYTKSNFCSLCITQHALLTLSFRITPWSPANAKGHNTHPSNVVVLSQNLLVLILSIWMTWQMIVPLPCLATSISMASTHLVSSPMSVKEIKRASRALHNRHHNYLMNRVALISAVNHLPC